MLKKDIVFDILNSNNSTNNNTYQNLNIDELTQLINRLSDLFIKYISQLKSNIIQNKEIISFVDKKTNYIQTIINNIFNHNYNLEQLKSLEEAIKQIKEKNNNNNLNIFNDEQNLNIFLEETNILFKSIKQKYKIKLEEWSNYLSIPISIKSKNSIIKNNNINNVNAFSDYNQNNNFYKVDHNSLKINRERKRTKSTENNNQIDNNRNMNISKSQRAINNKYLVRTAKSTRNKKINDKKINLINLNIPMNKSHSIYNIDIRNEVLLNKCFKSESNNNDNNVNKNVNNENGNYRKTDVPSMDLEQKILKLNKEVIYYKKLVNLLSNNNNNNTINLNNNNMNNNNKLLLDKLKLKENEIISKDKKIKFLYQEINKLKNQKNNMNNANIQSEMGTMLDQVKNAKSSINIKDSCQRYKTESNLSNQIKFNSNSNCGSNSNISKENNLEKEKMLSSHNENLNYLNRIKFLEKENSIMKTKLNKFNIELSQKPKRLENENILFRREIIELKKQLKKELNKKDDLNKVSEDQKIQYEYEISKINDQKTELSKMLSNKNAEIIKLQQEIIIKDKELEKYKVLLNKKDSKTNMEQNEKIKQYYNNILIEKGTKELKLNNEIIMLNEKNDILFKENEKKIKEISELNNNIKDLKEELLKQKDEINNKNNEIIDIKNTNMGNINKYESEIQKLKEENDGLKQFTLKQQKMLVENEKKDELISSLKKEKETLKQYFIDLNIPLPSPRLNDSIKNIKIKKEKLKTFEEKFTEEECFNILNQLNEAKKEIENLKKKNEQLFNDLDSQKLKNDCFNHISIEKPLSNYEEEFDLKKMAKGVKEKNRSQDINIDYPGIQQIKERYRELDFYYNSLEELVKKMLLSSTCTNKNKMYMIDLCKIVGFDEDITNKIVNNKIKKGILKLFG